MTNILASVKIVLLAFIFSFCNEQSNNSNKTLKVDTILTKPNEIVIENNRIDTLNTYPNEVKLSSPLLIKGKCINGICLGTPLKTIVSSQEYIVKDTLLEDEATWPAKVVYNTKGEIVLMAEANWDNKEIVSRIVIWNGDVKTNNFLSVGMTYKMIKRNVSNEIPSVPDGYIMLKHKENKNLFFEFDTDKIEKSSTLLLGVYSLSEVPDNLKVKYMLIM